MDTGVLVAGLYWRNEAHRCLQAVRDADLTDLEKPFGIEIVTPRQYLGQLPRQVRRQLG